MARIGIFGGSFDPIHSGHVGLALRAAREYALERVLVVPAHVSPFKTDAPPMDDGLRWELVKLACAPHPVLEPCDIELKAGGTSYAIDTVRRVRADNPGTEIYFIIGEDSVAGLPKWKDWNELRTLAKFVSFPRTRESSTEVRRRMALGLPLDDMVPEAVARRLAAKVGQDGLTT